MSGYNVRGRNYIDDYSWSVIFAAIVIGVLCVAGYVFAPKGDNQTYSIFIWLCWLQCLEIFHYF